MVLCTFHIGIALSHRDFFDEFPEFEPIKDRLAVEPRLKGGIPLNAGISREDSSRFFSIAKSLSVEKIRKLIDYMGIKSPLAVSALIYDPSGIPSMTTIYDPRGGGIESPVETNLKGETRMSEIHKPGVMLGGVHITKAVSDPNFFALMPEFASVKAQIATMHIDVNSKKGCNTCNKRRLHANIDGNFAAIASRLPEERAQVLKKYLGLDSDQPLFIRAINPADRKLILKRF